MGIKNLLKNRKAIERIAEEVHNSWMKEKLKQQFHSPRDCEFRDSGNDKFKKYCDKCHTDIYPYNELPDNIKSYDRVTVIAVLNALEKEGSKDEW